MKKTTVIAGALVGVMCSVGIAGAGGALDGPAEQAAKQRRGAALERALARVHRETVRRFGSASASRSPFAPHARRRGKKVRGPRGARGPRGPRGAQGPAGPRGGFSVITQVSGAGATLCDFDVSCAVDSSVAQCPPGQTVLGGGWDGESLPPVSATVGYNQPLGGTAWMVIMANNGGPTSTFHAVATCVGT